MAVFNHAFKLWHDADPPQVDAMSIRRLAQIARQVVNESNEQILETIKSTPGPMPQKMATIKDNQRMYNAYLLEIEQAEQDGDRNKLLNIIDEESRFSTASEGIRPPPQFD